jgi:hypothetical protein
MDRSLFTADDADIYDFAGSCDGLIAKLPSGHTGVTNYFTAGGDPVPIRQAILDENNGGGTLLTVYNGHGNTSTWGEEDFFSSFRVVSSSPFVWENDVEELTNVGRPTVGVVLNCLSGYFAAPDAVPLMGEAWVNHDGGGAVAFWASTGLTRPAPQDALGQHFFDLVFAEGEGVLGDAVFAAKLRLAAEGDHPDVIDTWGILGDPALSLAAESRVLAQPNPLPPPDPREPRVLDGDVEVFGARIGSCALGTGADSPSAWLLLLLFGLLLPLRRVRAPASPE